MAKNNATALNFEIGMDLRIPLIQRVPIQGLQTAVNDETLNIKTLMHSTCTDTHELQIALKSFCFFSFPSGQSGSVQH